MAVQPGDFFDIPYGPLPTTGRVQLDGNKIVSANAEVRFLRDEPGVNDQQANQIRELLGKDLFPFLEQNEQRFVTLNITEGGGVEHSQEVSKVWQLSNEDRSVTVTLAPLAVNVQVLNYLHFQESLACIFSLALGAYASTTNATIIQRLGLRYINRLTDPEAKRPEFWSSVLSSNFSGPTAGVLGSFLQGARQQMQLRLEPTVGAVVNSVIFQDSEMANAFSCLVDIDVFDERATTFESKNISDLTRKLNRTAYGLFAETLTNEFLGGLKNGSNIGKDGEIE